MLDNLSVHKARIISEQWDRDFAVEYLPPYSCTLNSIERLWNVVKG